MAAPTRPPANTFVAKARKVYNPIGFSKGYNFILWFIFAGAMFGFALARMMFLNYNGIYCNPNSAGNGAGPGECWSYNRRDLYKIGVKMHLYTIIPASFLVVFQFVPFIRYKALLFHRMNGYIVVVLTVIGTVGAIIIAPVAFGGSLSVRAAVGLMSIMFLGSLFLAIWNIKTLQLEQHRAWMLRAWFYAKTHRLHLTPAETERLRRISFQRQQERGFKNPGSSGLTSDRLGDAETWRPGTDATAYSSSKGSDSDISNVAAA
ncbi:hypothetical protein FOC4_g10002598 [Fusarium odoratissimum]|uniref:Uncharacterized protein n=1 Tax=Fusarium oxysporum f. sp. cubense (strain race 4) TaxID=2502994 RepID=N1SAD0_FUSC4|nr:hypothetical protein FOC4_g10002598 [Fusarium odoratissimum]